MYFYGYSHTEVLALPLRIFWLLCFTADRLRAERNLTELQVASAAQSTKEGFQQVWKGFSNRMGKVMEIDQVVASEQEPEDVAGKAELRRMFGIKSK